jgi:hypothetical protein
MNENYEIKLLLTVAQVNAILGVLGRQPYQEVEALILDIRHQARPQLENQQVPE